MKFLFTTVTTMKEYNRKKWWIDGDIIPQMHIEADNLNAALKKYQQYAYDKSCINVSDNALKNKLPMYIDTKQGVKQTGYVITGSCDFEDRENYRYSKQYVDLWIDIETIVDTDF